MKKYICIFSALLLAFGSVTHFAHAVVFDDLGEEVVGDFVVGPGKVELELEPGEEEVVTLLVSNRMGDDRVFKLEVEDVSGSRDPELTVVLLGNDRGPHSLRDYITIDETSFELPHGKRARVPVVVRVPEDAEPGGYYGSVLVSTASKSVDGEAPAGTQIVSRIGSLFFVRVPGEAAVSGSLLKFDTLKDSTFFTKGPIDFGLTYENTGSVHVNPYGEISIKNILGEEIDVVEVTPWFALPSSVRFREVSWERMHMFGYYTAEARINRGYDDIIDTKSVSFYVIPLVPLAWALGALVVIVMAIRFMRNRFELRRKV